MSSPENLLKAAINRLRARLGQKFIEVVADVASTAQDAPERISREWDLFQEEVRAEVDRLSNEEEDKSSKSAKDEDLFIPKNLESQDKIDRLRAKVSDLNRKLEMK